MGRGYPRPIFRFFSQPTSPQLGSVWHAGVSGERRDTWIVRSQRTAERRNPDEPAVNKRTERWIGEPPTDCKRVLTVIMDRHQTGKTRPSQARPMFCAEHWRCLTRPGKGDPPSTNGGGRWIARLPTANGFEQQATGHPPSRRTLDRSSRWPPHAPWQAGAKSRRRR